MELKEKPRKIKWPKAGVYQRVDRQVRAKISISALNSKFKFDTPAVVRSLARSCPTPMATLPNKTLSWEGETPLKYLSMASPATFWDSAGWTASGTSPWLACYTLEI